MSSMTTWLRNNYCDGPETKRMRFSDILEQAASQSTSTSVNPSSLSRASKATFPNTEKDDLCVWTEENDGHADTTIAGRE